MSTNYVIATKCGDKTILNDSRVHELKGELRKIRLAKKEVTSLVVQTKPKG